MLNRLRTSRKKSSGSVAGALFGILLFLGSTVLLWVNEGRTDLSKIARKATQVNAETTASEAQGQLVSITGELEVEEAAGDSLYGIRGDFLRLERNVEMFAWKEREGEDDTYAYETEWSSSPQDSSQFEYPLGHSNPAMPVQPETFYAYRGYVGNFTFDPERTRHLPTSEAISIDQDMNLPRGVYPSGGIYLYSRYGAWDNPQVGDVRISYEAVSSGHTVTLFGVLQERHVEPYIDGKDKLYGIWSGNHNEALDAMHTAYVFQGWTMRIGGIVMMWISMNLILGPLTNLVGGIPILGDLSRGLVWAVTFIVALVLSILIIIVSFVVHRWYLLLLLLVAFLAVLIYLYRKRQQEAPSGKAV